MFYSVGAEPTMNPVRNRQQDKRTLLVLGAFMIAMVALLSPELAMADPWNSAAQKVADIFTSGLARLFAIIAVIACGIAALAGKLSWDWAIKITIGIVLIFGSASIVDYIIAGVGS